MVYAYLRVSTDRQEMDGQKFGVEEYCKKRGMGSIEFFEDTVSGAKASSDRKLGKALLPKLKEGDVLVVAEISRLGRKMSDVLQFMDKCREIGVELHAIKQGLVIDNSLNSKIMAYTFAMCAEIERELCVQRIRERLAAKRARGERLGREKGSKNKHSSLFKKHDLIEGMLKQGMTRYKMKKVLSCHGHTLNSYLVESGLAEKYNIPMTEHFMKDLCRTARVWPQR